MSYNLKFALMVGLYGTVGAVLMYCAMFVIALVG